jgi:hypothetical protein
MLKLDGCRRVRFQVVPIRAGDDEIQGGPGRAE